MVYWAGLGLGYWGGLGFGPQLIGLVWLQAGLWVASAGCRVGAGTGRGSKAWAAECAGPRQVWALCLGHHRLDLGLRDAVRAGPNPMDLSSSPGLAAQCGCILGRRGVFQTS